MFFIEHNHIINNHIRDKKNPTEFSLKAIRSEIRFYTNPGLY